MLSFEANKLHMPAMYKDAIERGQDKTFVIYQRFDGKREEFSYNYINQQADKLIDKLTAAGLKKGDRIAVISSLRPWWYALSYACLRQEYIMVCIDPGVPASQTKDLMAQTEVRAVFTSINRIFLPEELEENIPVFSIEEDFPLLSKCNAVNPFLDKSNRLPDDTFYILFSSGTTSERRKAVLLKHSSVTKGIEYGMSTDAGIYKKTTAYTPRQRDLMLFPPYHIAGLLCATYDLYCNTQVIMLERLTPNALVSVLQELKPDNICTVPSMLTSLYKKILASYSKKTLTRISINTLLNISAFFRKNFGIKAGRLLLKPINKQAFGGNMKGFMIGASPFDKTANKFFLDMGIDVSMAYGLTELGAPLATTGQGYYPGTAGRVIQHNNDLKIRIVNKDENGKGEVEILSPYRMITYLNEEDNIGCFSEDGYFRSGDLGYFNEDNCLNICGRIKESIVLRNGEKLLPEEIENRYQDVDCVSELVAFKVPGEGGCDDFSIAIIKDKQRAVHDEAMKARVYDRAEKLPPMYRPKDVYVLKEFPLSSSHKVQRFRLTEMVVKGESDPITDASMIPVDEDEISAELRRILIEVGGSQWKTQKLTQGVLLNLDSLSMVNLYVAIQEHWNIDLFQSSIQAETFGQLLDIVRNFETIDKNKEEGLDLSKYPLPVSIGGRLTGDGLLAMVKQAYHVKAQGLENLPKDTAFLFCANHRTDLDPAFIFCCLDKKTLRKTCVIGKSDLLKDKFFNRMVSTQNFLPIERAGNSIKTLERSKDLINEGYNMLIFPEGTSKQNNTKMYSLKNGAAKLAIATNKPIVPVHLTGVAHYNGEAKTFELPSFKSRIHVSFGKAIYPDSDSIEELNEKIRNGIEELD